MKNRSKELALSRRRYNYRKKQLSTNKSISNEKYPFYVQAQNKQDKKWRTLAKFFAYDDAKYFAKYRFKKYGLPIRIIKV